MKYILLFVLLCFVSVAWAQIPTNPIVTSSVDADPEVMEEEVCWTTGGVDRSLTRFYYVNPSDTADNQILFYVNAMGAVVDVSGGTLTLGYCGCCEEGTGSTVFDSDRPILRTPTVGTVIGGTSVTDWLDYWYFAPPTLSLSRSGGESTTVEVGTETTYTFTATTNNPGGATLSNGHLFVTGADTLLNFTSTTAAARGLPSRLSKRRWTRSTIPSIRCGLRSSGRRVRSRVRSSVMRSIWRACTLCYTVW